MGTEREYKKVNLFSGIIFRDNENYKSIKGELEKNFSTVDLESEKFVFDSTDYYNEEMGFPLYRKFISFTDLTSPEKLPDVKVFTNELEVMTSVAGKRTVNIDPGYISEANVIIATTKNYYHRVPLDRGVYAHIEYVIRHKKIVPMEWTYPDFKKPSHMEFFSNLRILHRNKIRATKT